MGMHYEDELLEFSLSGRVSRQTLRELGQFVANLPAPAQLTLETAQLTEGMRTDRADVETRFDTTYLEPAIYHRRQTYFVTRASFRGFFRDKSGLDVSPNGAMNAWDAIAGHCRNLHMGEEGIGCSCELEALLGSEAESQSYRSLIGLTITSLASTIPEFRRLQTGNPSHSQPISSSCAKAFETFVQGISKSSEN